MLVAVFLVLRNNIGARWMLGVYGPVNESAAPTSADLPAELFRRAVVPGAGFDVPRT